MAASRRPSSRQEIILEGTSADFLHYAVLENQSARLTEELNRLALWWHPAAKHLLLETTGTEITRLMDLPYEDRRPDNRAHVLAHRIIVKLVGLGFDLPASDVYSDSDKAIRVLWNRGGRNVEIVFPSTETESPYLYRSESPAKPDPIPCHEIVARAVDPDQLKNSVPKGVRKSAFILHVGRVREISVDGYRLDVGRDPIEGDPDHALITGFPRRHSDESTGEKATWNRLGEFASAAGPMLPRDLK